MYYQALLSKIFRAKSSFLQLIVCISFSLISQVSIGAEVDTVSLEKSNSEKKAEASERYIIVKVWEEGEGLPVLALYDLKTKKVKKLEGKEKDSSLSKVKTDRANKTVEVTVEGESLALEYGWSKSKEEREKIEKIGKRIQEKKSRTIEEEHELHASFLEKASGVIEKHQGRKDEEKALKEEGGAAR
ncbi:hypothetical protein MLD52_05430 [Puniceicoccaceae bacterium K14]|nr:hypothetical protein [Puniceicoccaceae bacterium K14]